MLLDSRVLNDLLPPLLMMLKMFATVLNVCSSYWCYFFSLSSKKIYCCLRDTADGCFYGLPFPGLFDVVGMKLRCICCYLRYAFVKSLFIFLKFRNTCSFSGSCFKNVWKPFWLFMKLFGRVLVVSSGFGFVNAKTFSLPGANKFWLCIPLVKVWFSSNILSLVVGGSATVLN